MHKIVHYLGLDVHEDSIAVAIAPQNSTDVRTYGIIARTVAPANQSLHDLMVERSRSEGIEIVRTIKSGTK